MKKKKLLLLLLAYYSKKRAARLAQGSRRFWVQTPNITRSSHGGFNSVISVYENETTHQHLYRDTLRMTPECFELILNYVREKITKQDTHLRKAIPPELRLACTLLFLSTGDSIKLVAMFFRLGISTTRQIIYETCSAIWEGVHEQGLFINTNYRS